MRWVCQKCGDEDVRIPHHTGEQTPRLLCAECYCDYLANELDFVEGVLRRYIELAIVSCVCGADTEQRDRECAAYQRGAEAMREAAAINCASQIRALPIPEDKP